MLSRRALARALALVGVTGAVIASAVPANAAPTPTLTSSSPAVGAIVKPSAVPSVLACFSVNLSSGSLSLSNGSPVAGTSATDNSTCHGVRFTPLNPPLADGVYTASYNVLSTAIPPVPGSGSFVFKVDGTAPAAPTIGTYTHPVTSANATAVSVTGTAESSHPTSGGIDADPITVTLTVHSPAGGTDVTQTTTTDAAGNYSFTNVDVSGLTDTNALSYSVKATDSAGNVGTATTQSGVTKDTVGPALASSVPANGTSHQSTSTVVLNFNEALDTAASSATVSNKLATPLAADAPVFSNGNTTMTLTTHSAMSELGSPYSVSYTVHDVLGNVHTGSFTFTIDDTPPATPTNVVATDPINSLNQTAVVVSGDAETGSTDAITLSDGTHQVTASTTAANGHFQSAPIDVSGGNLTDGTISVSVIATDAAGNSSSAGSTTVTKDVVVPSTPTGVTIAPSPVNAAGTSAVTVSATVSGDTTNATITIDDADGSTSALSASGVIPDGSHVVSHTFDVSSLANGTLTASVVAFDANFNPSVAGTNTATKDSSAPAAPSVTLSPKPVNGATAGVTVSGTAEASSTVHLLLNDSDNSTDPLAHDVVANPSTGAYTWTFTDLSSLHDGLLTATVTAEDAVHNVSDPGTDSTTMDRVAPDAPAGLSAPAYANSGNVTAYPVSGTAESGATVTVTFTDSHNPTAHSLVKTTSAGSDGNWSVAGDLTSPALFDEGALHISVTATDAVGNVSGASTLLRTKDTTLPAAPRVDTWTHPIDSTNVSSVAVAGTAGATENGAGINVSIDDANPATNPVTGTGTADGTGAYTVSGIDVSSLDDGTLTFTVTATDVAGNTSATSTTKTAAKDTIALAPVSHTPSTPTTKTPATVTATYNEPLDPSTSSITVTDSTLTDAAGTTSYTNGGKTIVFTPDAAFTEAASPYHVKVVAKDAAGDSTPDLTFDFTVDNTAPAKPVVSLVTNPINAANETAVAVSGTAEDLSSVVVTISDGTSQVQAPTSTNGSGAWSVSGVDVSSLADGTLNVTAVATDGAGNASDASDPVTTTKDTVAPAKPVVSSVTNPINSANKTAVVVSGTAENLSSVVVTISDGTSQVQVPASTNGSGAWSVSGVDVTSLADGTLSATAVATDAAGNPSVASDAKTATKDTVAPAKPVVSSVTDPINAANKTAVAVSGTAENLSSVVVTITDGTSQVQVPASTNGSGAWSVSGVDVSSLADGTLSATAVATDAAGNSSVASDAKTATKDTVAPAKPVVSSLTSPITPANETSVSVSGTAENGASVAVDITDGTTHIARVTTADGNGAWSISGIDVSSLADGTVSATAVATDAAGNTSATSNPKTAAKHTVVPSAPRAVTVVAGDGSLTVSWTAPATDGGDAVKSYRVTVVPHAGGTSTTFTTLDAATTSHAFSGLTNGTLYDVSVVANNVAGSSSPGTGSGTPKFVATLTIHDSAGHVIDGAKITLSGVLKRSDGTGVAGATVTISRAFDGRSAARLLTVTTGSTGAWSTTFAVGFNATYTAAYAGNGSILAATSPNARTTVAPLVSIRSPLNRSTSSSAVALKITGRVAPNKAGRLVVLYYVTTTGKLVRLTTAKLSSTSTYVLTVRLKRGTWHLRVVIGASPGNSAGSSSTLTVKRT